MSPADFKIIPALLSAVVIYTCGSAVMDARRKADRIGAVLGIISAVLMMGSYAGWWAILFDGFHPWTWMNLAIVIGFWVIAYRRIWGARDS